MKKKKTSEKSLPQEKLLLIVELPTKPILQICASSSFHKNLKISLSSPSCIDPVESIGVGRDWQGEPNLGVWHLN